MQKDNNSQLDANNASGSSPTTMSRISIKITKSLRNCQRSRSNKFIPIVTADGKFKFVRPFCKTWGCKVCAAWKNRVVVANLRKLIPSVPFLSYVVFTLRQTKCTATESIKIIRAIWCNMRKYLARKYGNGKIMFAASVELHRSGYAHLNVLLNRDDIEPKWLRQQWVNLGGGENLKIKKIATPSIANYICKDFRKGRLPSGTKPFTHTEGIALLPKKAPKDPEHQKIEPIVIDGSLIKEGATLNGSRVISVEVEDGSVVSFEVERKKRDSD